MFGYWLCAFKDSKFSAADGGVQVNARGHRTCWTSRRNALAGSHDEARSARPCVQAVTDDLRHSPAIKLVEGLRTR